MGFPGRRRRGISKRTHRSSGEILAASYARVSTTQQSVESIDDQQHACRQAASQKGHQLLPAFKFSDYAISGTKRQRPGLDALLRAAENADFQVLYVFSLSRLARESVIAMALLKRIVSRHGIRVISLSEGIDTDTGHWELIASLTSVAHERYIKDFQANVERGRVGVLLAGLCVGDLCYGYSSEPILGSESIRPVNSRPKKRYVIDRATAPWVVQIFHWYVADGHSFTRIAQELNRRGAPLPPRVKSARWDAAVVARILRNEKYIGIWPWAKTKFVRDPETGKTRQRPRGEQDPKPLIRHLPQLSIVDPDTFAQAQQLLRLNDAGASAPRHVDGEDAQRGGPPRDPRKLLSGLIRCAHCGANFRTASDGWMYCPGHVVGTCRCRSRVRRREAEQKILDAIGTSIRADSLWCAAVHERTQRDWLERSRRTTLELKAVQRELATIDRTIARTINTMERGGADRHAAPRLGTYCARRREIQKTMRNVRSLNQPIGQEPDVMWVREQLPTLGTLLTSTSPEPRQALRDLIWGPVVMRELEGRLQARFRLHIKSSGKSKPALVGDETGGGTDTAPGEIVIDFVLPVPHKVSAERVVELRSQGLTHKKIAQEVGCSTWKVAKLLEDWHRSKHDPLADTGIHAQGTRRGRPLCQTLSDDAKRLFDEGLSKCAIARRLGCCHGTIRRALAYWYKSRGLDVPKRPPRSRRRPKAT